MLGLTFFLIYGLMGFLDSKKFVFLQFVVLFVEVFK